MGRPVLCNRFKHSHAAQAVFMQSLVSIYRHHQRPLRLGLLAASGAVGAVTLTSRTVNADDGQGSSLPIDKLACRMSPQGKGGALRQPVVLLGCGSYNPPTFMHLRMFEAARDALGQRGFDVLGGYMSPVNDSYGKEGLEPAHHRIRMCHAAVADSDWLMVDDWEARASEYQRSLPVLRHVASALANSVPADGGKLIRVMLLCGSDMLESFCIPGMWSDDDMDSILREHGVAVIMRPGSKLKEVMADGKSVLWRHKEHIVVVHDVVDNPISSTAVRKALCEGRSVKYLVADPVMGYMRDNKLYV